MKAAAIGAAVAMALAAPAAAEVKSATAGGFEAVSTVTVAASAAQAYLALGEIGRWWSPEHSYSGDAANLSLDLRAGGCFCEKLPDKGGDVEFMRVAYAEPGRMLLLRGALGPLQAEAAEGVLTWSIAAADGVTTIKQSYVAGGYFRTSAMDLAPLVDKVMAEQLDRLKAYLEKPPS